MGPKNQTWVRPKKRAIPCLSNWKWSIPNRTLHRREDGKNFSGKQTGYEEKDYVLEGGWTKGGQIVTPGWKMSKSFRKAVGNTMMWKSLRGDDRRGGRGRTLFFQGNRLANYGDQAKGPEVMQMVDRRSVTQKKNWGLQIWRVNGRDCAVRQVRPQAQANWESARGTRGNKTKTQIIRLKNTGGDEGN